MCRYTNREEPLPLNTYCIRVFKIEILNPFGLLCIVEIIFNGQCFPSYTEYFNRLVTLWQNYGSLFRINSRLRALKICCSRSTFTRNLYDFFSSSSPNGLNLSKEGNSFKIFRICNIHYIINMVTKKCTKKMEIIIHSRYHSI